MVGRYVEGMRLLHGSRGPWAFPRDYSRRQTNKMRREDDRIVIADSMEVSR